MPVLFGVPLKQPTTMIMWNTCRLYVILSKLCRKVTPLLLNKCVYSRIFVIKYMQLITLLMIWKTPIGSYMALGRLLRRFPLLTVLLNLGLPFMIYSLKLRSWTFPAIHSWLHSTTSFFYFTQTRSQSSNCDCRSPHCQLCRKEGYYATQCPDLSSFETQSPQADANLATTFHS